MQQNTETSEKRQAEEAAEARHEHAEKEYELHHEIEVSMETGPWARWGDARTWIYILLLVLLPMFLAGIGYVFLSHGYLMHWNLGHPGTRPG